MKIGLNTETILIGGGLLVAGFLLYKFLQQNDMERIAAQDEADAQGGMV